MYKNVRSLERPKTISLATASGKSPVARLSQSHRGVALAGAVIGRAGCGHQGSSHHSTGLAQRAVGTGLCFDGIQVLGTQAVVNKHTQTALAVDCRKTLHTDLQADRWSTAFGTKPVCRQCSQSRQHTARHSQVQLGKQYSAARFLGLAFEFAFIWDHLLRGSSDSLLVPVGRCYGHFLFEAGKSCVQPSENTQQHSAIQMEQIMATIKYVVQNSQPLRL